MIVLASEAAPLEGTHTVLRVSFGKVLRAPESTGIHPWAVNPFTPPSK